MKRKQESINKLEQKRRRARTDFFKEEQNGASR